MVCHRGYDSMQGCGIHMIASVQSSARSVRTRRMYLAIVVVHLHVLCIRASVHAGCMRTAHRVHTV